MSILRLPDWLLLLGLAATSVLAEAAPGVDAAQRQRIATERAAIERDARTALKACTQQFAVTDCAVRAKADRRLRMQPLERELAVLDDELRKRRAAERLAQIEQRKLSRAAEPPEVTVHSRKPAASAPAPVRPAAARASEASESARRAAASQAAAEATRRAAASARRIEQAQAHRLSIEQRNRERTKSGGPAQPLPVPPGQTR
ncbi:MAG: hypothetical protein V4792_11810 [Pseudomonadota bacterium]